MCEELRENPWSKIECGRFVWQSQKCSIWCDLFARCFYKNGAARWARQCTAMFRHSSPSRMVAAGDDTFHVHPCPSFWKNEYAVRVSHCNCSKDDNQSGK